MTTNPTSVVKSKKQEVLDLLQEKELTVEEIERQTNIERRLLWVYINMWKKEGKVIETGEIRNKFRVYRSQLQKPMNTIDLGILKKIIPKFVELGIKDLEFKPEEIERIKEIFMEVNSRGEI